MGAVINIGAEIGAGTMIDMGANPWWSPAQSHRCRCRSAGVEPFTEPVRSVIMSCRLMQLGLKGSARNGSVVAELIVTQDVLKMWSAGVLLASSRNRWKHNKKQHSGLWICNILIVEAVLILIERRRTHIDDQIRRTNNLKLKNRNPSLPL